MIFFSILLSSAFENTLGKAGIPYLALPFCLIATCTFLTLRPENIEKEISAAEISTTFENTSAIVSAKITTFENTTTEISWCGVGQGVLLSMGQVYAINDLRTSTLMNLAVFLASPLLFITCSIGALLGSLAGKKKTLLG